MNGKRSKVFSTVAIDLFAVVALVMLLKQQVDSKNPYVTHEIAEYSELFIPVIFVDGHWGLSRMFSPQLQSWVQLPQTLHGDNYFTFTCFDKESCFKRVPGMSKPPVNDLPARYMWALPKEREAETNQLFTEHCSRKNRCQLNFLHTAEGITIENISE